jgi:hypothetical protein
VDALAEEFAGQPVLFLEQRYTSAVGERVSRFWAGFAGGQAYYPLAMVDSGQQVASGGADFQALYRQMVQTALARPAQAEVSARYRQVEGRVQAEVTVTNGSTATLSAANGATVHILVYEHARVLWTGRYVRGAAWTAVEEALPPGATRTFSLETDALTVQDWNQVRVVALVDYRPGGNTGPYDMLQAALGTLDVAEPEGVVFVPLVMMAGQ